MHHVRDPTERPRSPKIAAKKTKPARKARSVSVASPEAREIGKKLASLAQDWVNQEGHLRVRQREQLRRALAEAAELFSWTTITSDPVNTAIKDVAKLTKSGTTSRTRELADEVASKKTEIAQLKKTISSLQKLAKNGKFEEPVEVAYSRTAREGQGLGTKTETLTLANADEATDAAASIEKNLESWGKLREQMVEDLKACAGSLTAA